MVGIVIVSHSATLARGVAELARQMAGPDVVIAEAGGTDLPSDPLGTDATRVAAAVERAMSEEGVLVLMDVGSAVLSAELALDLLGPGSVGKVLLSAAPLVEGAVSAATAAGLGRPLAEVAAEARAALQPKLVHLAIGEPAAATPAAVGPAAGPVHELRFVVKNRLGLHARPAARLVTAMAAFAAEVRLTNVTAGRGPADARSLNAVATLGVRQGDEVMATATGPDALAALAEAQRLADCDFGDARSSDRTAAAASPAPAGEGTFAGTPASPGVAVGPVRHARRAPPDLSPAAATEGSDPVAERQSLQAALALARDEVAALRSSVAARAGEYEASILDVHRLLLDDRSLLDPVWHGIEQGGTAIRAWEAAVRSAVAAYATLDDPYQRARAEDVADVGRRVLGHLIGTPSSGVQLDGPGILVAPDLSPGEAAGIDPALLLGVATAGGGPLGHGAILARALGIPAVVGLGEGVLALVEGTVAVLDGGAGTLRVDPRAEPQPRPEAGIAKAMEGPARTADGVHVVVAANVGSFEDSERALAVGAEGVGLLRTEFLFAGRSGLPTEEEQVEAYRRIAAWQGGRSLVIRTLDAGADKLVAGLVSGAGAGEANPALGVRGLRLGLAHPDVLATQLRAVLRIAAEFPIAVMFPMVTTVDEIRAARSLVADARSALLVRGLPVPDRVSVGVMVEVPAAALAAEHLAPEVDFFSIGTNDLTQYVMAADRTNAGVAALADGLHPAVLRLVDSVVAAAAPGGQWVGVCGELAADPAAVPVLVGLGVRELSVRRSAVAATAEAVAAVDTRSARTLARAALAAPSAAAVRSLVAEARSARGVASARLVARLTWSRIALVPAVVALVLSGEETRYAFVAAAVLFGAAALTDLADGYLARRWGQTSRFGAFLDTTADKVLIAGALVALVAVGRASPWWAAVIVIRELAVLALRGLVAGTGTVVPPSLAGKLKANFQFLAVTLAIVRGPWRWGPWHPDEWAMAVAAVLAVFSGAGYFVRFRGDLAAHRDRGGPVKNDVAFASAASGRKEASRWETTSTGTR